MKHITNLMISELTHEINNYTNELNNKKELKWTYTK